MEKLFKEVVTEDGAKTYEEVPMFKSFENEEEYNKTLQSASSKAKGDILGELGIKSVAEFKENYKNVGELNNLQSQLAEKENKLNERTSAYNELENKFNEAVKERNGLQETLVLSKYKVPDTFQEDFKTLVKAGVNEDLSFEESAQQVYERLNITQVKNKISIGNPKAETPLPSTEEEKERLRKL